jgi:hypothetical protein
VITFQALGGADNIVVNDLSGTDLPVGGVLIDLASTIGGTSGDGQVDRVTVNGTAGNEAISIRTVNGFVGILGSSAPVAIFHAESTDQLVVNGNAGNDTINASDLTAGQISLTLNGGQLTRDASGVFQLDAGMTLTKTADAIFTYLGAASQVATYTVTSTQTGAALRVFISTSGRVTTGP